jgi:hypothetical protein
VAVPEDNRDVTENSSASNGDERKPRNTRAEVVDVDINQRIGLKEEVEGSIDNRQIHRHKEDDRFFKEHPKGAG